MESGLSRIVLLTDAAHHLDGVDLGLLHKPMSLKLSARDFPGRVKSAAACSQPQVDRANGAHHRLSLSAPLLLFYPHIGRNVLPPQQTGPARAGNRGRDAGSYLEFLRGRDARSGATRGGRHSSDLGGRRDRRSARGRSVAPRNSSAPFGPPAGDRPRVTLLPRKAGSIRGFPAGRRVWRAGTAGGPGGSIGISRAGPRGSTYWRGDRVDALGARDFARSRRAGGRGAGRAHPRPQSAGVGRQPEVVRWGRALCGAPFLVREDQPLARRRASERPQGTLWYNLPESIARETVIDDSPFSGRSRCHQDKVPA